MRDDVSSIQLRDGIVTTDPYDFPQAIEIVQHQKLKGIHVHTDDLLRTDTTAIVDLAALDAILDIEDFSISINLPLTRLQNFEHVHGLSKLTSLSAHNYPALDLSLFPNLKYFSGTDHRGLAGLQHCAQLEHLRLWKLREGTLSNLDSMTELRKLWLSQAQVAELYSLGDLPSLESLELQSCNRLQVLDPLPLVLKILKVIRCRQLTDLGFLEGNHSLMFLYAEVLQSLSFAAGLIRLEHIGFQKVIDEDLTPLLKVPSLQSIGAPNRKGYTPSLAEVKKLLSLRSD